MRVTRLWQKAFTLRRTIQTCLRLTNSIQSVFTIFTGRELHYKLCESEADADMVWLTDGTVRSGYHRWGLTQSELDALDLSEDGPDWARGHLHELIEHLSKGGTLPFETKMKGGSAATLISIKGTSSPISTFA